MDFLFLTCFNNFNKCILRLHFINLFLTLSFYLSWISPLFGRLQNLRLHLKIKRQRDLMVLTAWFAGFGVGLRCCFCWCFLNFVCRMTWDLIWSLGMLEIGGERSRRCWCPGRVFRLTCSFHFTCKSEYSALLLLMIVSYLVQKVLITLTTVYKVLLYVIWQSCRYRGCSLAETASLRYFCFSCDICLDGGYVTWKVRLCTNEICIIFYKLITQLIRSMELNRFFGFCSCVLSWC